MSLDTAPGESLAGRTAIVTGGSRGIGQAIARRLARDGVQVVVAARSAEDAERVAAEITNNGGDAFAVACDVREARDIARLVERTLETFGRVDIVINNAGISPLRAEPHEIDEEIWDAILDTNLKGAFLLSKAAAPGMIARGEGVIVNIASIAGVMPIPLESAYCASKAGMINVTRVMAIEWAEHGIRVNAVCPTFVDTPLERPIFAANPAFAEDIDNRTPMRRLATPEEVAAATLYLLSPASAMTTGHALPVDGGWTAW